MRTSVESSQENREAPAKELYSQRKSRCHWRDKPPSNQVNRHSLRTKGTQCATFHLQQLRTHRLSAENASLAARATPPTPRGMWRGIKKTNTTTGWSPAILRQRLTSLPIHPPPPPPDSLLLLLLFPRATISFRVYAALFDFALCFAAIVARVQR